MTPRILIVEDDPIQRRLLEEAVKRFGYQVRSVDGGEAALTVLTGPEAVDISLVVLDLVMPDLDGISVLTRLREAGQAHPVIVQTANGGIDVAVNAMRAGACDFVVKPVAPERLQVSIANALKVSSLEGEVRRMKRVREGAMTFADLVTKSTAMDRVIRLGERAAASSIPVLIEGESGVGKEVVARAIQGGSDRRSKPFVTVNCGAIPDNLVESILFGHEKGSFTGAVDKHVGKFQEAHGGTLFLDEVGELPLDIQVKLLRALQEGEIEPVGGKRPIRVDFRLISATNRSLIDMVKAGRFREDLYYRLNVFPIHVPALRDRKDDIPHLVRHFIGRFAAEEKRRDVVGARVDTLDLLSAYDWPGNIRQLENAVFRAVILAESAHLTPDEFPQIQAQVAASGAPVVPRVAAPIEIEAARPFTPASVPAREPLGMSAFSPGPSGFSGDAPAPFGFMRSLDGKGHARQLADVECEMIKIAIDHYGGRMAEVARRLGIGRSTLYRKLKDYGFDVTPTAEAAE